MKKLLIIVLLLVQVCSFGQTITERYAEDPASVEHEGVPKGEVRKFSFNNSKIFPGTSRDYWIYIPAQYRADKPACVYVNQDGIQWKAPTVFDNLIYSKEMPVTIGVFINPGIVKALDTATALNRYNRSFEYDGLGDAYARFILEEIFPDVEKQKASDGRAIKLSKSGNDRAIGGSSSGAVCAFTAAWERPLEFSRVFSAVGTYVGLRGADRYPTLVRKYEPRPLRIFLQDGTNDLNIYAGDWWKANETMERALTFSGYELKHIWGEGQHSVRHGTAIFPEVTRFLWKDWPKPVTTGISKNQFINDILIPGSGWELVGQGYGFTEGTAADAAGNVFFHDIPNSKTYKVDNKGNLSILPLASKKSSGTSFGSGGKRYVVAGETKQILSYDATGKEAVVANEVIGNDLVVAKNGNLYVTSPDGSERPGKLYLVKPDGKKIEIDAGLKYPNGVALSPDQSQLYVTESATQWVWAYQVQPDGLLENKQRYGWLHETDIEGNAWGDGLKCDRDGRVYVASRLGIQVLDQTGRVNAIIPVPSGQPSNVCFGGSDFDTLYVSAGDKVYRRKVKVHGANTFDKPTKPAAPRL
ncbi:SMP-30/gluconolactonase/LRE family protein [Segetibacter sp.]|jgi:sugar lactone lactonase YvrE/predicted alpha/beta superfamily hydrolase|uniref:SMP-30/gluconolactonase/LRE family protein n=1 Tax=Segetibacter sp. TaxID=2231182 RepID=UPI002613509A|nr:SMP-30/gluconolactonase/LRE family protein [Segetibacter sp.]MCW3080126.1 SMP-30/Gluconolaconase/LRE-like region-containing protein [Segetibacter sp.]